MPVGAATWQNLETRFIGLIASRAVPCLGFAIYAAASLAGYFGGTANPAETEICAERMTILAIACWLAGRVARYFLAGT
jgi:hypothetical protein